MARCLATMEGKETQTARRSHNPKKLRRNTETHSKMSDNPHKARKYERGSFYFFKIRKVTKNVFREEKR
jgi:hypothetical protein